MSIHNPVTISGEDTTTGDSSPIKITDGALHSTGNGVSANIATNETITAAADDILGTDIDCSGLDTILVRIEEVGTVAGLDQFDILGSTDGTNFETLYSTSADYLTPTGILIGTSGDLKTLAASSSGWYILDCRGINTIRHLLSGDGGIAVVDVDYSGK